MVDKELIFWSLYQLLLPSPLTPAWRRWDCVCYSEEFLEDQFKSLLFHSLSFAQAWS